MCIRNHGPLTRPLRQHFTAHKAFPLIVIGTTLAALALLTIYNL